MAISRLLSYEQADVKGLQTLRDEYELELKVISGCFDELKQLTDDQVDPKIQDKFEEVEARSCEVLLNMGNTISQILIETRSKSSVRSKAPSSKSNSGHSATSRLAEAAADVAELETRVKFLEVESKQKAQLEKTQVTKDLEIAKARVEALSRLEGDSRDSVSERGGLNLEGVDKELDRNNYVRAYVNANQAPVEPQQELLKVLCEQLALSRLPIPEPSVFTGDPLQFPSWKKAFETLISSRSIPKDERVHYLKRYLGGEAKACIEGCFMVATPTAYEDAFRLLEGRYGDTFVVANAFRDKLESWPKIQSRDSSGLRKFVDFLRQCESAMKSLGSLRFLDDDRENRKLLLKLPDWLVTRWGRIVSEWKVVKCEFPPFKEFVKFLTKESDIANDPITSIQSLKGMSDGKGARAKVGTSLNTGAKKVLVCFHCKKNHPLHGCKAFLEQSLERRKALVKTKGLCYGCLGKGHLSKDCKHKSTCEVCKKRHPTALHDPKLNQPKDKFKTPVKQSSLKADATPFQPQVSTVSPKAGQGFGGCDSGARSGAVCMSVARESTLSSMIVPVHLSHISDPSNERLVYALLDTQSDTSFVLDSTCKALGLTGSPVKLSLSTMFAENRQVACEKVNGLMVRSYDSELKISLPHMYTRNIMPANRTHIPSAEMTKHWPRLQAINNKLMPVSDCEIGLLIGYNCPRALIPREVITSSNNGPYAQRTDLGWGIVGVIDSVCSDEDVIGHSHRILAYQVLESERAVCVSLKSHTKEIVTPREVLGILERDFQDSKQGVGLSKEDRKFLDIMEGQVRQLADGHYELPLPFKSDQSHGLRNNISQAFKRLEHLKSRLERDSSYKTDYVKFMDDMIEKGYAEKIPDEELDQQKVWYIPHHGVYNSQKRKIRVVFDCSARYQGKSLNDCLLQGPDLTNSLIGVLCRFRKDDVAFMCDITKMFYQFRVRPEQRDFLRFLWWDDGDTRLQPSQYRMTVHIFGASSSPGCSNFGLKRMASDFEDQFGSDVGDFIRDNFYVDDGLKSVATEEIAIDLICRTVQLCGKGKLKLHKFVSNSRRVLESIVKEDRADDVQEVDLRFETLPVERALGVEWCIESDTFRFRVVLKDRPFTRRGLLSTIASIYDPLGFIAPFTLVGKRILQNLCIDGFGWDDSIPESSRSKWQQWLSSVVELKDLDINRCVKPKGFQVSKVEFHHFCDASLLGYGQCSYLRMVSEGGVPHVTLVMAKARVVPIKPVTVPRLELTAGVVAVRVAGLVGQAFGYPDAEHVFWTDSKVVLAYIANESRRFHLFVANRVGYIHSNTDVSQWKYVPGSRNVADIASRGSLVAELKASRWFVGPEFLWQSTIPFFGSVSITLENVDPEIKKAQTLASASKEEFELERFEHVSSLYRLKKAVALCIKFGRALKSKVSDSIEVHENAGSLYDSVEVADLREAELRIVSLVQRKAFADEMKIIRSETNSLQRKNPLLKLDPFVDSEGILRVAGRIRRAGFDDDLKHPILLPRCGHYTQLVIGHSHAYVKHQGRGMTLNETRLSGYWIVGGSSAVSKYIYNCVTCRKVRSSSKSPKMADLPSDRLEPGPPFTNVAVDYFGPFIIKEYRKEIKRWGVIFTCLSSRAVHLEIASSLTTSSFINALRRFIAIRGPIALLRSDQGTNFVGARNELQQAVKAIDNSRVRDFLVQNSCDFEVRMNPPHASHMGGVWERLIRSVRSILEVILSQQGSQLDDESLRTYMCEIAAIINSRPLTLEYMNDTDFLDSLTPNHLLTMKSKIVVSPPGEFRREDVYSVKRWRRVQYLVDLFWSRWKKEYLHVLQARQKWLNPNRNMKVGDIVIVKEENVPRNKWTLGRVTETLVSEDNYVRSVKLAVGDSKLDKNGKRVREVTYLERPVHKLILLVEA